VAGQGRESLPRREGRYYPAEVKLAVVQSYLEKHGTAKDLAKLYSVRPGNIYDWARVYRQLGEEGLRDKSPAAAKSAKPVPPQIEKEILETKKQFGWFGVPRLVQWLRRSKLLPVTETQVEKTLEKAGIEAPKRRKRRRAEVVRRFERAQPNELWQVDITMWTIAKGQKVYLIAFMDDYSRYIVGWGLFSGQASSQVLEVFRGAIGQYGRPKELLSDQGRQFFAWRGKCPFQKELAREGIHHVVSRAHHPETLGKVESFWKHIKDEFLSRVVSGSINDLRERLRLWIESYYNFQRPHQGIEGSAPADRYFKVADEVRKTIEQGVKENAERLSLGKDPVKPFYMVGRMGDQAVVIRQEGGQVVMNVGQQELEKVELTEENDAKAESGSTGGGGKPGSKGAGPGGAPGSVGGEDPQRDLPGDGAEGDPVLQAGSPASQGDGDGGRGKPPGKTGAPAAPGREPGGEERAPSPGEPADAGDAPSHPEALQGERKEAPRPPAGVEVQKGADGGSVDSGSAE
jgi:transposase InsO family protein